MIAGFWPLTLGNDASVPMHIVATNIDLVLMLAAMGFAAAAFHGRFRVYTLATIVTTVATGVVAFASVSAGPSLWLGIGERTSIWAFLLWVVVLAFAVGQHGEPGRDGAADGPHW